MGDPDADFDKLLDRAGRAAAGSTPPARGTSTARSRSRWTRCGSRPATRRRDPLRRRAPAGRAVPAAAVRARPAAARRADQPPRRRVGGLARADAAASMPARSWPSPTTATSSTTWPAGSSSSTAGAGIPWKGNYSSWLEQKQARLAGEEKADERRQRTLATRARVDPHVAPGPPGQGQGPHQRLRGHGRGGQQAAERGRTRSRSPSRPGPAWATWSSRPRSWARASAIACCSRADIHPARPAGSSA